jgi:glucan biosynthesis protein C
MIRNQLARANGVVPIEEIRIIATILLVLYHVIGVPGSGLKVADDSALRWIADALADFRMPAFAFIAGFVYALRPAVLGKMRSFLVGKFHRLVVPGAIAMAIFLLVSHLVGTAYAIPWTDSWRPFLFPYAHYWFLQSILLIFVVVGALDALTRQRAELGLLVIALGLYLSPLRAPTFLSMGGAIYLAPFFLAGVCFQRRSSWIEKHAKVVGLLCLALVLAWIAMTVATLLAGEMPGRGNVQGLLFAVPLCTLIILLVPHHPQARRIGKFSFTIYLYHIFGTAGVRMTLQALGITNLPIHLVGGLLGGIFVPTALHLLVMRWPLGARLMLGLRPSRASAGAADENVAGPRDGAGPELISPAPEAPAPLSLNSTVPLSAAAAHVDRH